MTVLISICRVTTIPEGTFGVLLRDNWPIGVTLEKPWRGNKRQVSCIPEGKYRVVWEPPHKPHWHMQGRLMDVPGRSGILIHPANIEQQLKGCIAVGKYFSNENSVQESLSTHLKLIEVTDAQPFELQIINECPFNEVPL